MGFNKLILPGEPAFDEILKKEIGSTNLADLRAPGEAEGSYSEAVSTGETTPQDLANIMNTDALVAIGFDGTGFRVYPVNTDVEYVVYDEYSPRALKEDVVVRGDYAVASSDLFTGTQWSQGMAHGPDMMLAITEVVEALVDEDDILDGLQSVRFNKPLASNMDIFATKNEADVTGFRFGDRRNAAVYGSFETDEGEVIHFVGFPNGEPIERKQVSNMVPFDLVGCKHAEPKGPDSVVIDACDLTDQLWHDLVDCSEGNEEGFVVSTLMDMVMLATRKIEYPGMPNCRGHIAGGFKNVKLPELKDLDQLGDFVVTPDFENVKVTSLGVHLVTFKFEVKDLDGFIVAEGEYVKGYVPEQS